MNSSQERFDIDGLVSDLGDIPVDRRPNVIRQKSRDFYWYSPILKKQLDSCLGDIVVSVRNEADITKLVQTCIQRRIPITIRGGGTGNYGQAVPLFGGVVLDMLTMRHVGPVANGVIRVGPGAKLKDIEAQTKPQGWELQTYPSTKRSATIGGYIAGGSGGIGSVKYGMLREEGAIEALRVVTVEESPRLIDLRGADVNKVHHAYGTNGIITEIALPLALAVPWLDLAVAFHDFMALARFCQVVSESEEIEKKLVTAVAWPIPKYFTTLPIDVPPDKAMGLFMIAPDSERAFAALCSRHGGKIEYRQTEAEITVRNIVPIYEYTWNHTTLQALKVDSTLTYLQLGFPPPQHLELVKKLIDGFPDELSMHLEFVNLGGQRTCSGLPILRFTTPDRLFEIIRLIEAGGVAVFNPHTFILEDGGRKTSDEHQVNFKREADPYGLLNPGKMRAWGTGHDG